MGLPGAGLTKLRVLTGLDDKTLDRCLSLLISKAQGILWDKEERAVLGRQHFDTLCAHCLSRAEELHRKEPLKAGFAREAFLGTWSATLPKKLVQKVFDALIKDKKLSPEGDGLRLATHTVTLAADEEQLAQKIMRAHKDAGHTPPNYKDVLSELGVSEKEAWPVLTLLVSQGRLVRIKDGLYYEKSALEDILTRVRTWFQENDNLDIAALKSLLGLSRKYLVNLLEYMDNAHITVRVGDARHLRQTN